MTHERIRFTIAVRTLTAAVALVAAGFASAEPAAAKEFCAPKIVNPSDGAYASTTPTIQATAKPAGDCSGNAKKVKLEVTHVASGNTVYKYSKVRGKGLTTGRFWKNGMLLLDHTVPAGQLKSDERYRIYVEYPNTGLFASFDEHVGCCTTTFRTGTPRTKRSGSTNAGRHTLVIDSRNVQGRTDYVLKADGPIRQVRGSLDGKSVTVQSNDKVSGNTARGTVRRGRDGFRIDGDITSIKLTDPSAANLFLDGHRAHTVVFDGAQGGNGSSRYAIEAGAAVHQLSGQVHGRSVSVQSNDKVQGRKAVGYVGRGRDGFLVAGAIREFYLAQKEAATLLVDGRSAHSVMFDGSQKTGATNYALKADGPVLPIHDELDGERVSVNNADSVQDGKATGRVSGGRDGFIVGGDINVLSIADPGATAIEFDNYQAHTVVFDGAQRSGATRYTVKSGLGPIEQITSKIHNRSVSIQSSDQVNGGRATGRVSGGRDGFLVGVPGGTYGGFRDITMTDTRSAVLYVDGQRKKPSDF